MCLLSWWVCGSRVGISRGCAAARQHTQEVRRDRVKWCRPVVLGPRTALLQTAVATRTLCVAWLHVSAHCAQPQDRHYVFCVCIVCVVQRADAGHSCSWSPAPISQPMQQQPASRLPWRQTAWTLTPSPALPSCRCASTAIGVLRPTAELLLLPAAATQQHASETPCVTAQQAPTEQRQWQQQQQFWP